MLVLRVQVLGGVLRGSSVQGRPQSPARGRPKGLKGAVWSRDLTLDPRATFLTTMDDGSLATRCLFYETKCTEIKKILQHSLIFGRYIFVWFRWHQFCFR